MSQVSSAARAALERLQHARRVLQPHPAAARAPDRVLCPSAHAALVRPCALSVASWSAAHSRAPPVRSHAGRRSSSGRTALGIATRGGVSRGCEGAEAAGVPGSCDRVCVSCVRTTLGSAPAGRRSSARRGTARAARRDWPPAKALSQVTPARRGVAGASVRPPPPIQVLHPERSYCCWTAAEGGDGPPGPTRDRTCCRVLVSAARRRLRYGTTTGISSRHISIDAPGRTS